jgi:hypothetical protein
MFLMPDQLYHLVSEWKLQLRLGMIGVNWGGRKTPTDDGWEN